MDNLNVDMLLDSEIKEMENQILEKQLPKEDIIYEDPGKAEIKEVPKAKTPTKAELVENYQKLAQASGQEIESEARLKRMTKQELTKKIAEIMNREIGGIQKSEKDTLVAEDIQMMKAGAQQPLPKQSQPLNADQLNLVAEGLFQMNLAFCSIFETGSHAIKSKTYDVALLENWAQSVANKRNELICIFKQMYCDYKETFDKYLSPVVQWSMVMVQTGACTVISNLQKKKEQSNKD